MSVAVTVRMSNSSTVVIDVNLNESVSLLKSRITDKTGLDSSTFKIIFSGKILDENCTIKDLSLGNSSVLHLYSGQTAPPSKGPSDKGTPQYYVYCKVCEGLHPGKLRVGCSQCGDGAIVLQKEPDNWEDVLVPSRLSCHCTRCDQGVDAQFYFKCASHDSADHALPLQYIHTNTRSVECVTCAAVSSPVLLYPCENKHVMCLECFTSYTLVSLDNRAFIYDPNVGYSLPCPAGCENSLINDVHHFCLLGRQQYERYKDFGAEVCLLQSGGVICPQPGCGEGMIVDPGSGSIICGNCKFEFCRTCKEAVHFGECQRSPSQQFNEQVSLVDSEQAERARWDHASMDTILQISKPCPHCATRTEKSGGCMHITCTVCKGEWCWLCEKDWTRACQGEHWFG